MGEKVLEDFDLRIAFFNVAYLIKNKKTKLSENSKIYIEWAKEYFTNVQKSLDSILDEDSESYFITPHFLKVIEYFKGNEKPNSVQDAKAIRRKCTYIINSLDNLKNSPEQFYKTESSKLMLEYFNNFSSIF